MELQGEVMLEVIVQVLMGRLVCGKMDAGGENYIFQRLGTEKGLWIKGISSIKFFLFL